MKCHQIHHNISRKKRQKQTSKDFLFSHDVEKLFSLENDNFISKLILSQLNLASLRQNTFQHKNLFTILITVVYLLSYYIVFIFWNVIKNDK